MKRLCKIAVLLCAALCLAGCGGVNSFTWFVESIPANLDPQVASASEDVIACTNLCGSLLRRDAEGALQPDLAESYTVSPDGLRYTFTLKSGLSYVTAKGNATEYTITAEDFVYAFRRIFSRETASPYTSDYAAIQNSTAVLDGSQPASALGVSAADDLTVVFTLSEPDAGFAAKLALPGGAPCDEAFFLSTKGTYGLTKATTLSSGAFYLYNWTESGLFLRRALSGSQIDSLRLVQNSDTGGSSAEELITNEKCSAALDTGGGVTSLQSVSYTDTTWGLAFRCEGALASAGLRQALAAAAQSAVLPKGNALYGSVEGLVPDGVSVDGVDYRAEAGNALTHPGDMDALYSAALSEVGLSSLKSITILLPADAGVEPQLDAVNSVWQKQFSLFFSVEALPREEFDARISAGTYTIALLPVSLSGSDALSMLKEFSSGGFTGYASPAYDALLAEAATASGVRKCALMKNAETALLADCPFVPLFSQQKRLLIAHGIHGLVFSPYGPVLDLSYATRES